MADDNAVLFVGDFAHAGSCVPNHQGVSFSIRLRLSGTKYGIHGAITCRCDMSFHDLHEGSCTPDINELPNSVVTLERTDKNSEKPAEFRQLIDRMYTTANGLNYFHATVLTVGRYGA